MNRAVFFRCCLGAVSFLLFVFSGFGVACGNRGCLTEIAWKNRSVVEWERVMLINSMNDLQGRRSVSSAEPEQVKLFVGELNEAVSDGRFLYSIMIICNHYKLPPLNCSLLTFFWPN